MSRYLISTTGLDEFVFHSNPMVISQLNLAQRQSQHLTIPTDIQNQFIDSLLQSNELSFCTYYCETAIVKTIIYPEGQIIQQISQNLLPDTELLSLIAQAHYWIISELLLSHPIRKKAKIYVWVFLIGLLIVLLSYLIFTLL